MKITSKGQVTIPQHVRERCGFAPGTEVDFVVEDGAARLVKATGAGRARIRAAAAKMRADNPFNMTTDEYMRLVRGEWPYQGP